MSWVWKKNKHGLKRLYAWIVSKATLFSERFNRMSSNFGASTDVILAPSPGICVSLLIEIVPCLSCLYQAQTLLLKFNHYYRPQTKFAKVMFLHLSVILFTGGSTWAGTSPGRYTPPRSAYWDTVSKRAVRIPLECILVAGIALLHNKKNWNLARNVWIEKTLLWNRGTGSAYPSACHLCPPLGYLVQAVLMIKRRTQMEKP